MYKIIYKFVAKTVLIEPVDVVLADDDVIQISKNLAIERSG